MNYFTSALWVLLIGVSFGLGWGSFWLLALGLVVPLLVLLWGLMRWVRS